MPFFDLNSYATEFYVCLTVPCILIVAIIVCSMNDCTCSITLSMRCFFFPCVWQCLCYYLKVLVLLIPHQMLNGCIFVFYVFVVAYTLVFACFGSWEKMD